MNGCRCYARRLLASPVGVGGHPAAWPAWSAYTYSARCAADRERSGSPSRSHRGPVIRVECSRHGKDDESESARFFGGGKNRMRIMPAAKVACTSVLSLAPSPIRCAASPQAAVRQREKSTPTLVSARPRLLRRTPQVCRQRQASSANGTAAALPDAIRGSLHMAMQGTPRCLSPPGPKAVAVGAAAGWDMQPYEGAGDRWRCRC